MASRYKAYPEYKDSGVRLLGDIPSQWAVDKFRYLFSLGRGLGITKANLQDSGIPCVNYGEIHSKYGFEVSPDTHPLRCVSELYLESSPNSLLSNGDCIFADTSEDIEGAGNFTQLTSDQALFAGYHTVIARPKGENDARFLAYVFDSPAYRTQIRLAVKGVKVFSITQEILKNTDLWLAPLPEQKQIAKFLDHETAKIDLLIAKQQALIALLKEKRQAVISHAVTKGLNPNAKMKDSGVEWLGQVPEEWELLKIAHSFPYVASGTTPNTDSEVYYGGKHLWVTTGELRESVIFKTKKRLTDKALRDIPTLRLHPAGSVAIAMYGATIGRIGIFGEAATTNQACCVMPPSRTIYNKYLFYWLFAMRNEIINLSSGGGQPNVNQEKISSLKVSAPSIAEQTQIAGFLDLEMVKLDALGLKAESAIELMQERRTAVISAAVTGKIDVRDWEPAPEAQEV